VFDLVKQLCDLTGPSGQEGPVLEAVESLWREAGCQTERTRLGTVIGRAGGSGPRVLLAAHADELCYLVRSIDPKGYLWLANGQAWTRLVGQRNWFTVGQRVRVLARSGELPGVIASVTGHAATLRLADRPEFDWDDLWVDTGLTEAELRRRGVTPGTRIVWDQGAYQLGDNIVGKALDDRASLAAMCEVVRRVPKEELAVELVLAATVQEEIGIVGATGLAARERFDAAVIVESGLAGDVPRVGDQAIPLKLGAGPALVHKDSMVHYDHRLTGRFEQLAGTNGVPLQHAVYGSYGSDGAAFMRADVPTALITFPTRYTHTPFETASLADLEAVVTLLSALVREGLGADRTPSR
jgi:putative aminopeptidase FrvX